MRPSVNIHIYNSKIFCYQFLFSQNTFIYQYVRTNLCQHNYLYSLCYNGRIICNCDIPLAVLAHFEPLLKKKRRGLPSIVKALLLVYCHFIFSGCTIPWCLSTAMQVIVRISVTIAVDWTNGTILHAKAPAIVRKWNMQLLWLKKKY